MVEETISKSFGRKSYVVSRPYGEVRKGEVPRSAVAVKPREEWSTEDVAEYVIKRACKEDQCTYLELIENPQKNVSKNEYKGTFVSQARRCRFADLVGALVYFYTLKKVDIADQYVWLDIFSANQPKLTARNVELEVREENERQLTEGLHVAIANFEQRVMFMDRWDGAAPLTRAWCVWEIFGVAKAKKPLEIALPESEYDRFIVTLKEEYKTIITKTAAVDVEKARCFNLADLEAIHKAIREESSFQMLDDIIKTQLRLWVASAGKLQVEKEEQKENPALEEIYQLANLAGMTYRDQGDLENAELLLRKALRVAEEVSEDRQKDAAVATILSNMAEVFQDKGRLAEAESLMREALQIKQALHGRESAQVALVMNNLAQLLQDTDRLVQAEPLMREVLQIDEAVYGRESASVARDINNLACLLQVTGRSAEAEQLMREALQIDEAIYGRKSDAVARDMNNLALVLKAHGQVAKAEQLMREALQIDEAIYGRESSAVARDMNNLAQLLKAHGQMAKAEQLMRETMQIDEGIFGRESAAVARDMNNLAQLLKATGRLGEAEPFMREVLQIHEAIYGRESTSVASDLNKLAQLLEATGRLTEAEPLVREVIKINEMIFGRESTRVAADLSKLAKLLKDTGRLEEAEPLMREALTINEAIFGPQHSRTEEPRKNLADLLRELGREGEI